MLGEGCRENGTRFATKRRWAGAVSAHHSPALTAFGVPLKFSPDGTKIGFIADILVDNKNELYVVAADGATPEKRVTLVGLAADAGRDVQAFTWSPDSTALAFVSDHRADNDFELFRVPNVTTADQAPVLVRGVAASGDVTELAWRP